MSHSGSIGLDLRFPGQTCSEVAWVEDLYKLEKDVFWWSFWCTIFQFFCCLLLPLPVHQNLNHVFKSDLRLRRGKHKVDNALIMCTSKYIRIYARVSTIHKYLRIISHLPSHQQKKHIHTYIYIYSIYILLTFPSPKTTKKKSLQLRPSPCQGATPMTVSTNLGGTPRPVQTLPTVVLEDVTNG